MKILSSIWFTSMGSLRPVGIVIGKDEITKEKKAYIGTGMGLNEKDDEKMIAAKGAKLNIETLQVILNQLSS